MKILIVNTYDKGGAANACLRLHEGLLKQGLDSKVLLRDRSKKASRFYRFRPQLAPKSKLQFIINKFKSALRLYGVLKNEQFNGELMFKKTRSKHLEYFSFPSSAYDITQSPLYEAADVINLHWVADFLDYKSFFEKNTKPVVWTLHDMNPFTGGEHYTEIYSGMDDLGHPIPRELTEEEKAIFKQNLDYKHRALAHVENLSIVAPSQWLANEAKASYVFQKFPVHCIPYGINGDVFRPRNQEVARDLFQIPQEKKVILFVADSISSYRKGYQFLNKALEMLKQDNVVLCAIGAKQGDLNTTAKVIELGVINDELLMSMAYSAADVFVIPSLMDNLPNTVLESLMCGTPVIGFPTGGIKDMVKHGENGLITKTISSDSLSLTLNDFLENRAQYDRETIRKLALEHYDLPIQAQAYMSLYNQVLKS